MSYDTILARTPSIIFRPGAASSGIAVATWTEVQAFVALRQGAVIVLVDDSIVTPAHVPAASGITDFQGKGEIRPFRQNFDTFSTLVVDSGATLKGIFRLAGTVEVLADTQGATPAFDFDYAADASGICEPTLFVTDQAVVGTTTTATQPAIVVPAASSLFMQVETSGSVFVQSAAPLVHLAAASSELDAFFFGALLLGAGLAALPATWVNGAGTSNFTYDEITAHLSPGGAPLSSAGTKLLVNAAFAPPPSWTQAAWFIDPANSTGNASDGNDGLTALTPLLTYAQIVNRWGTTSPTLRQTTTITWLSSWAPPMALDPVICTPEMRGGVLVLQGTAPTVLHAGAFPVGGVTPKNRAAAQLLACNLGFAAAPGQKVVNTTAGKLSEASVYTLVGGTTFNLTQPVSTIPHPPPFSFADVFGPIDTWASGDTFEVLQLVTAQLVLVQPTTSAFQAPNFPYPLQIFQLEAITNDGVVGDSNSYINGDVSIFFSTFDSLIVSQIMPDDEPSTWADVFAKSGVDIQGSFNGGPFGGALITSPVVGTQVLGFDSLNMDVIVDASAVAGIGAVISDPQGGVALFQGVYIAGTVAVQGILTATVPIWGPGTLDVIGSGRVDYTGGAAASIFLVGALTLNSQANANAFNPATGLWSTPIAITSANLDLAFGAGGFGGLATNVGGASISDQRTP